MAILLGTLSSTTWFFPEQPQFLMARILQGVGNILLTFQNYLCAANFPSQW